MEPAVRGSVGGASAVVLGADTNDWTTNSSCHGVGGAEAAAAAEPRVRLAPGGAASIAFGEGDAAVSTEDLMARPSPGGADSVIQILDELAGATPLAEKPSSFAAGVGQSAGKRMTKSRSTTRVQQAPGGASSITMGEAGLSATPDLVSSNKFANRDSQNVGNCITGRSTTRLSQAPGGTSTICLGGGGAAQDENVNSSNVARPVDPKSLAAKFAACEPTASDDSKATAHGDRVILG